MTSLASSLQRSVAEYGRRAAVRLDDVKYNVYPREIEEVLYEHPGVLHAAVIGIPHPVHGEAVGAAVELRAGSTATSDELRDYAKARVAAYEYPRHVWLSDIPIGPTGKILKREIEVPAEVTAKVAR